MGVKEALLLLGIKVTDTVTGFKGVVTSIGFDLYGCIQAVVTPEMQTPGKLEDSRWFDVARLEILSEMPVMHRPRFVLDLTEVAAPRKSLPGPQEKPILR